MFCCHMQLTPVSIFPHTTKKDFFFFFFFFRWAIVKYIYIISRNRNLRTVLMLAKIYINEVVAGKISRQAWGK